MAVGELIVSIFSDKIVLELFKSNGKTKTLVKKHFEKYHVSLNDISKIEIIDIEKTIDSFLSRSDFKSGKVYINIFGGKSVMQFEELDMDTVSKKTIKKLLPLELEALGDEYVIAKNKYEILGSKVKLYFLSKNIVENFTDITLPKGWDLISLTPGFLAYQGLFQGDGVLVEVQSDSYDIYTFKNGYLFSRETYNLPYIAIGKDDITPNEIFDTISEELVQEVKNFNIRESVDIDLVYVTFTNNIIAPFVNDEVNGILFENPRDLRNWIDVDKDIANVTAAEKSVKDVCEIFNYSPIALGTFYNAKELPKFSFSKERLSYLFKNVLVATLSFSIVLGTALPSFSILTDSKVAEAEETVATLSDSVTRYKTMIEELDQQVIANDKIIDDYNAYVSSLGGLTDANRNFISSVLSYLPTNTPNTILIDEIQLAKSNKTLVIKGVSSNYKDVGSFAIELEEFGKVTIDSIENNNLLNVDGYPFILTLVSK